MSFESILQRRMSARSRCFMHWAVAALAAACATDDVASPSSGPDGDGVRDAAVAPEPDESIDAGGVTLPVHPDAGLCPAPRETRATSLPRVWSRAPSGDCCAYENSQAAPPVWPYFETEADCQGSCRCSTLEDFIDDVGEFNTELSSLECRCSAETCPSTVAEAEQIMCNRSPLSPVVRREGCGRVMIVDANGLAGEAWIFERPLASTDAGAASERLIGAGQFGDVAFAPCQTYQWIAGRSFECEDFTTCQLCGDQPALPPAPACE